MAATGMATGATGVACSHCGEYLGSWQERDGRRAFLPALRTVRAIECGDGWTRLRCRRCDNRTTLVHVDEAA